MRVVVDKGVLRGFVRRALRRYPLEYLASLWGRVVGDEIHICLITHIAHVGTPNEVVYDADELNEHHAEAAEAGMRWLGTIHSHPDDTSTPSIADCETATEAGEMVMGICAINKRHDGRRRTDTQFWPVVTPAKVEITE